MELKYIIQFTVCFACFVFHSEMTIFGHSYRQLLSQKKPKIGKFMGFKRFWYEYDAMNKILNHSLIHVQYYEKFFENTSCLHNKRCRIRTLFANGISWKIIETMTNRLGASAIYLEKYSKQFARIAISSNHSNKFLQTFLQ